MHQNIAIALGIKINYLIENEFQNETIFFIHGNSISSRTWKKQLCSKALQKYRLIAFDLPAHGDSEPSKNHERDYSLPGLASIIAAVIKELANNSPYLLVGLSLGTNILAESLVFGLKPMGVVLAGSCIAGGKYTPDSFIRKDTHVNVVFTDHASRADVEIYATEGMYANNPIDKIEFVEDYFKVHSFFRSSLINSIELQNYNDEIDLIKRLNKPVLLIFGQNEKIIDPDYLDDAQLPLWNTAIYKISNAGHLVNMDQADEFNRLLANYAEDIFK